MLPSRNTMGRYASFYWPLALSSLVLLLESQFQSAVLARDPHAGEQLATFALAISSFQMVNASLGFVPQTVTVLGRMPAGRRICLRFVLGLGLLLSLPLAGLSYLPQGRQALTAMLNIPAPLLPETLRYLRWLSPLVLVNALREFFTGLLILRRRTRVVTLFNAVHLVTLVGLLLAGQALGRPAAANVATAMIVAHVTHLLLNVLGACLGISKEAAPPEAGPADAGEERPLTYTDVLAFYWPVAVTSTFFAMTRPVLYAFINRTAMAVTTVAALRLAFDVAMIFQMPVNQFRHVYTTFGHEDPEGVRRFMARVTAVFTAAMVVIAWTPCSRIFFGRVLGVQGEVLDQAVGALRVLCLAPAMIALRNVYHGHMMVVRRTGGMAAGAALRVGCIGLAAWLLFRAGLLTHLTSAMLLVLGFATEAMTARLAARRLRGGAA